MVKQSLAGEASDRGVCPECFGRGWTVSVAENLEGEFENYLVLCAHPETEEPVRYGIEADISIDGSERYFVMAYTQAGKELVTVTGSALSAERDVRRLRSGESLAYDRRFSRQAVAS